MPGFILRYGEIFRHTLLCLHCTIFWLAVSILFEAMIIRLLYIAHKGLSPGSWPEMLAMLHHL